MDPRELARKCSYSDRNTILIYHLPAYRKRSPRNNTRTKHTALSKEKKNKQTIIAVKRRENWKMSNERKRKIKFGSEIMRIREMYSQKISLRGLVVAATGVVAIEESFFPLMNLRSSFSLELVF